MDEYAIYARRLVEGLQERVGFKSRDAVTERQAWQNMIDDKPAFGWSTSYSNQPAGSFVAAVNRLGSITLAQQDLLAYFQNNDRDVFSAEWLDGLLPLNRYAVAELMLAYAGIDQLITYSELRDRTAAYQLQDIE